MIPAVADRAAAGAWTLPEGRGQTIVTSSFTAGDRYFDRAGRLVPVPEYGKFELTPFAEYGVADWLTALASTSLLAAKADGDPAGRREGLGYTELGARARLAGGDTAPLSVQASVRLPGALDRRDRAGIGGTVPELDLRLLGGAGFTLGGVPAFVDGAAAYRVRGGAAPDERRIDLAFGVRPLPRILLLAQSFTTIVDGRAPGTSRAGWYGKLQGSMVYDLTRTWSMQAGYVRTIAGRDALSERGGILAVWTRF